MQSIELSRYRFSRLNPYAPPDRRYRIARICNANGVLPSFYRDDKTTWAIWKFLQKRAASIDVKQRVRLIRSEHSLSVAFRLHHGGMKHLRPLIEAYLLAALDDKSIAERVAAPPEAISWFRLAFYDVHQYLHAPAYVRLHLIRSVDDEGQTVLDNHRLWKLLGYALGPNALDQLLGNPGANKETFEGGGLAAWFSQETRAVLHSKQFIAASNLTPDDQQHIAILLKMLQQDLRGRPQSEEQSLVNLEQHVSAMLQELPWCKGPELTPDSVREWDERPVELNSDEMMLLAAGQKPAHLEELKNLKIPMTSAETPQTDLNTGEAE